MYRMLFAIWVATLCIVAQAQQLTQTQLDAYREMMRHSTVSAVPDSTQIAPPMCGYAYQLIDVQTADGLNLKTRIYKPTTQGPWPVLVMRTPYTWLGLEDTDRLGQAYARRGIAYIVQYCRGKGGSEGVYEPNVNERSDGLALVNWVADQPWCKNIGLFGESYTALTAWIIADILPEKVKGIFIHHYGVDRHLSAYSNGAFRQDILTAWAIDNAEEIKEKPAKPDLDKVFFEQMAYMPQQQMDTHFFGVELPWYRDWISHTDYTDPYWHQGVWATLRSIPTKIKVPIVVVAGHFDHHQEGTILGYNLLPEETKAKSQLIVGAWNHSHIITPQIGTFDHATDINLTTLQFQWFYDLLVKGEEPKPDVKVYAIGEDKWHSLSSWPIKDNSNTAVYYLAKDGKLTKDNRHSSTFNCQYDYDPTNPVLSIGGETLFNSSTRRGSQLQPEVGYRPDVLSFVSEALTEPLLIAGQVKINLHVSTDCDDTAFTYKISEVFPDGKTYNIRTGITTLGFRNNPLGARQTYEPGTQVELHIESLPIMWQLQPGSKIRLDISSSDFPQYSVHSNYAGVWSAQGKTRVAHQTLYLDAQSSIEIPLLK